MIQPKASLRPLATFVGRCLSRSLARQGFAATELITRWPDIVGPEVAAHSAPVRIRWPRGRDQAQAGAVSATLVLRVEGPVAIEIQHLSGVILERINQFFGWRAIGKLVLQQGPLERRERRRPPAPPSAEKTATVAAGLGKITDPSLRAALARLGAAIKQP